MKFNDIIVCDLYIVKFFYFCQYYERLNVYIFFVGFFLLLLIIGILGFGRFLLLVQWYVIVFLFGGFWGQRGVKNSFICICICNLIVDGIKCILRRVIVRKIFLCILIWIKMLEIYKSIYINYLNCFFGKFYQVIMINVVFLFQDEFIIGEDFVWFSVVLFCGVRDVSQC